MAVESLLELQQRLAQLLDRIEGPHPQELLLQGTNEPFGHAIALGGADEAEAGFDAQKGNLALKVVTHVLRAMVVSQRQAFCQGAELLPEPLVDGLQRLKARPGPGGRDADHVSHEVVDGHEYRGGAVPPGPCLGGVGAPHPVGGRGDDGSVMHPWATLGADSMWRLQAVFPHQPPNPLLPLLPGRPSLRLLLLTHGHLLVLSTYYQICVQFIREATQVSQLYQNSHE